MVAVLRGADLSYTVHQQLDSIDLSCGLAAYCCGWVGPGQRCCWPLNADLLASKRPLRQVRCIDPRTPEMATGPGRSLCRVLPCCARLPAPRCAKPCPPSRCSGANPERVGGTRSSRNPRRRSQGWLVQSGRGSQGRIVVPCGAVREVRAARNPRTNRMGQLNGSKTSHEPCWLTRACS